MDKPKFNFLDGVIILFIVFIVTAGMYFIGGRDASEKTDIQNTVAEFQIELTKADERIFEKFNSKIADGESVWIGVKERFEGKVSKVEMVPSKKITNDIRNGKAVLAQDPNFNDVIVTVRADVVETKSEISASGTAIRVGDETAIRGKGVAGYGFIVGVKTIAE